MQPNDIRILAPSRLNASGKSFAPQALLKILQESKNGPKIVTDPKGYVPHGTLQRCGYTVHTIVQSQEQLRSMYASNNWLKMHSYPIRRKMHNAHRRRYRKLDRHKKTYPVVVSVAGEGIPYEVDRKP